MTDTVNDPAFAAASADVKSAETFATTPVVTPVVESAELQMLNTLLNDWFTALKTMIPRGNITPANQKQAGATSLAIANLVCRVGTTELFDRLASFFAEHRTDVCATTVALVGNKYLDFASARKVSFVYHVFSVIGTISPITISGTALTEVTKCPALVVYLKSKNVRIV